MNEPQDRDPRAGAARRLHILCLEDEPDDAELIGELLRAAGLTIEMDVAATGAEFERLLTAAPYDIVLADHKLPGFDALAALEIVKERAPHIPLICVSGTIGEEKAVAIVREGAADYILKDRLARLPLAVERALADAERDRARRQTEAALQEQATELARQAEFLATLLDTIPSPVFYKDAAGIYLGCNRAFEELIGRPRDEIVGTQVDSTGPADVTAMYADMDRKLLRKPGRQSYEWKVRAADGALHDMVFNKATFTGSDGTVAGIIGVMLDISERKAAEEALARSGERLRVALHDTVRAMGAVVELRDPYTSGHERRVTGLAVAIAAAMDLDERAVETIRLAGEVHDVGKIGVPAEILSKPGALTTIERNLITQHPVLGYEILKPIAFDGPVAEAVRQHHERSDGSGYPQGLSGNDILLEARILAVADVVEAMASHRPYRPAFGTQIALAEVRNGAGTRYDRDVVAACERIFAAGFELDAGAAFDAS